jgi:hypothetical protein
VGQAQDKELVYLPPRSQELQFSNLIILLFIAKKPSFNVSQEGFWNNFLAAWYFIFVHIS